MAATAPAEQPTQEGKIEKKKAPISPANRIPVEAISTVTKIEIIPTSFCPGVGPKSSSSTCEKLISEPNILQA